MTAKMAFLLLAALPAAGAADVSMAFGDSLPPYIVARTDSGIELDVVRQALAHRGHVLRPVYLPMARVPLSFIEGRVDAIMADVGQDMTPHGGHYGAPLVLFDNALITLRNRHIAIRQPDDLKGLSVLAFVGAAKRYPRWLAAVSGAPGYAERNNQSAQPLLLALGRYDVVFSDRAIFQYHLNRQARADPGFIVPAVDIHPLPAANPPAYRPVFRDPVVRDDFDAGLAQLRKSGAYRAIYDKYLKE